MRIRQKYHVHRNIIYKVAPSRKNPRKRGHNYSGPGKYHVTIATEDFQKILGTITNGKMILNELGLIVQRELLQSQEIRKEITIDTYQIMPDHIHILVVITPEPEWNKKNRERSLNNPAATAASEATIQKQSASGLKPRSLGAFISGFKSAATRSIIALDLLPQKLKRKKIKIWQRNYFERRIKTPKALKNVRHYIINNPKKYGLSAESPIPPPKNFRRPSISPPPQ